MSSNQQVNNPSSKRMKSIRRQLAARLVGRKIKVCFGHDFILFLLILCTWFAAVEYVETGVVDIKDRAHYITYEDDSSSLLKDRLKDIRRKSGNRNIVPIIDEIFNSLSANLKFVVKEDLTEKVLVELYFTKFMWRALFFVACLFIVQILLHWMSYPSESAKVKSILSPINEIAKKADEIAKFDFSEDKYRIIEETITSIEPSEEERISLGDEDLLGVENAMNSLIARIRESNKQQARFVNDASHELRTPIAVIQGYANMLSRWGRDDEKVLDESIVAIKHESDNMKRLVEQLLFLARGDAGRILLDKTEINLNSLMQEVYEESLMIDENHIYKFVHSDEDIFLLADEGLLKQALRILVDNAAKYTNEKDEILLRVGKNENGEVFLQVQDSGIGMKQADIEHIFERFYRADEARSFNGTGLGLSIAKWIVDKHQGHFEIVSREEIGTRIGMYFKS